MGHSSRTHLVLVHHLDEEGEGKADLRQLSDGHAVLGGVELWGVVIDINNQDVEGRGDCGVGGGAVIIQLCALQTADKHFRVKAAMITVSYHFPWLSQRWTQRSV